ncbi:unnamed protein product [Periconia digitata]|uniref:Uncharacterized protein n=1 Tax=Periconia digitata TaxID=1303443 RepID=A0A9W4UQP0_9PLEO|nr:unnamed protein product [Periconia digitata]
MGDLSPNLPLPRSLLRNHWSNTLQAYPPFASPLSSSKKEQSFKRYNRRQRVAGG